MDDLSPKDGKTHKRPVSHLKLLTSAVLALLLLMACSWFEGQNMIGSAMLFLAVAAWVGTSVALHVTGREKSSKARGAATPAVHASVPAQGTSSPNPTRPLQGWRGNLRPGLNSLVVLAVVATIVLVADRPWNAPWWPGRHEASQLPQACVAGAAAAAHLTPNAAADGSERLNSGYGSGSRCVWRDQENGTTLVIDYVLGKWDGTFGSDATTNARKQQALNIRAAHGPRSRSGTITDFGDEAHRVWQPGGAVYVLVRRANVALSVSYSPAPSLDQNTDQVDAVSLPATEQAAREALTPVRLD
ncbi:hypothetical protein [Streptomyces sp. LS1784]|uniref:hypothetical protein n=1 Tax=Streptomyces sp. LS1784 TaxID=2851533 RepID=UPI001CCFDBA2|nr:hypothetical protein [Streptomyces sp. LS1784]